MRRLLAAVRQRVQASAWSPLFARVAAYSAGLFVLAVLGSGRVNRWLRPPQPIDSPPALVDHAAGAATAPTSALSVSPPPALTELADAGSWSLAERDAATEELNPGIAPDGKIVLNLASEDDLRHLPGIGATRARAILALRARLKHFRRVEDLLKVKGIGRRSLARIRPMVRVD